MECIRKREFGDLIYYYLLFEPLRNPFAIVDRKVGRITNGAAVLYIGDINNIYGSVIFNTN